MSKIVLFFVTVVLVAGTTAQAKEDCPLKNLKKSIRLNGPNKTAFYPQAAPKTTASGAGVYVRN